MPKAGGGGRRRVHASVEEGILSWAEGLSGPGKKFKDISHAIEFALYRLREQIDGENKAKSGGR